MIIGRLRFDSLYDHSCKKYIRYCSLICYHIYGKNRVISRYCNSGLNAILAQIEQIHPNENAHQNVVS